MQTGCEDDEEDRSINWPRNSFFMILDGETRPPETT